MSRIPVSVRRARVRDTWLGALGLILFFGIWEWVSDSALVDPVMVPAPSAVLRAMWQLAGTGELQRHVLDSLWRAGVGFLIGGSAGVVLGVAMARTPWFNALINPLVQMLRAIPSLAFVPLAIFWFGIGEGSKVFLIAWGVFFPIWVNTYLGVSNANPLLERAAASLGASHWRMLIFLILPAALPFIIAGVRVSLSLSLVVLVAAELTGANYGIGYLIQMSQQIFRVDNMFVGLTLLGIMGFAADHLFDLGVRRLLPWYGEQRRAK
ncbi:MULTISPECIES: ABC transporter permease [Pandoraea]|uniref:Sulfonate ABC transporter permease n=1 Tax=Pandoraea communis TaxID=2508297 RepID=A0A5E4YQE3_9BURK|nr:MULTISPECIES: ABC transporter permease [Pandoraea]EON14096.1 sulfonate ABC transporter permease [Pandoraea sp. SD6-2]VVE51114.1 sulfonate ABC transporter permease [Pandoraea communis]